MDDKLEFTEEERFYDIIKLMLDVLRKTNYEELMAMLFLLQADYLALHRSPFFEYDFETGARVPEIDELKWLSQNTEITHKTLVNRGTGICQSINRLDRLYIKDKTKELADLSNFDMMNKVCKSIAWSSLRLKGIGIGISKQAIYASYA